MGPGFAKEEICEKNRPGQKFMEREKRKLASESEKSGSLGREKGLSALGSLPSPIFAIPPPPFFTILILSSHCGAWNGQVPGQ